MTYLTDELLAQDDRVAPGALPRPQTAPRLQDVVEAMWEQRRYRDAERRPQALAHLSLARVVVDPALVRAGRETEVVSALAAHRAGDWGDVSPVTARHNEEHLLDTALLGSIVGRYGPRGDIVVMTVLSPTGTTVEVMADPVRSPHAP